MKITIKLTLILIFSSFLLIGGFFLYSTLTDYQPSAVSVISQPINYSHVADSNFTILTWNIGYAGLGANMDFFYDGGKQVRTSREHTVENLNNIISLVSAKNNVDFFLFQEVDIRAKRTYFINESDSLKKAIPHYWTAYADNFLVNYIPFPISDPVGSVRSGIQISSKLIPVNSTRYSFPGNYPWPNRIFLLDRGFIVNRYKLNEGPELLIINTHNSAFDDGSMKLQQIEFLIGFLKIEVEKGNLFVVGGDWNQNPPNLDTLRFGTQSKDDKFVLSTIDKKLFPDNWNWNYDSIVPTARSNVNVYQKNVSSTTVLDFFLTSPSLKVNLVKAIDFDFQNSDHQPVIMNFELKK